MSGIRYTLLGDGSSDRLLNHPIRWALRTMGVSVEIGQWADLSRVRPRPRDLHARVRVAIDLYPAQLLLVHRDAEGRTREERVQEVRDAARQVADLHVAVVPVRMTEAWFLHDEAAIRHASGNSNGTIGLSLPRPARVGDEHDPKETLRAALIEASELSGARRRKKAKDFPAMRTRVAELIEDFESMRAAPAFAAFLDDLAMALRALGYLESTPTSP